MLITRTIQDHVMQIKNINSLPLEIEIIIVIIYVIVVIITNQALRIC